MLACTSQAALPSQHSDQPRGIEKADHVQVDVDGSEYPFLEAYAVAGLEIPATQLQVSGSQCLLHRTAPMHLRVVLEVAASNHPGNSVVVSCCLWVRGEGGRGKGVLCEFYHLFAH